MLMTTHASAKFVILAHYELDDLEIDCFSQTPQALLFTKDAGEMNIPLDSLKVCYQYSTISHKEFFDCDNDKGLNRFVIDEAKKVVEHSFQINSIKNCSQKKNAYVNDFFLSRGLL